MEDSSSLFRKSGNVHNCVCAGVWVCVCVIERERWNLFFENWIGISAETTIDD